MPDKQILVDQGLFYALLFLAAVVVYNLHTILEALRFHDGKMVKTRAETSDTVATTTFRLCIIHLARRMGMESGKAIKFAAEVEFLANEWLRPNSEASRKYRKSA